MHSHKSTLYCIRRHKGCFDSNDKFNSIEAKFQALCGDNGYAFEQAGKICTAAHLMRGLLPRGAQKVNYIENPIEKQPDKHAGRGTFTSILGCIFVGRCCSCQKRGECAGAAQRQTPGNLVFFIGRFAAKSRIETNFSRVYLPNGCANSAEIL